VNNTAGYHYFDVNSCSPWLLVRISPRARSYPKGNSNRCSKLRCTSAVYLYHKVTSFFHIRRSANRSSLRLDSTLRKGVSHNQPPSLACSACFRIITSSNEYRSPTIFALSAMICMFRESWYCCLLFLRGDSMSTPGWDGRNQQGPSCKLSGNRNNTMAPTGFRTTCYDTPRPRQKRAEPVKY
jgi:hypothetical protein